MKLEGLLLAQDSMEGGGAGLVVVIVLELLLAVALLAGMWKTFVKAGKPGWAAIVPIYNVIVWLQIVGRPLGWIVLFLIPCVNVVAALIVCLDTARSFGRSAGFGIGLFLVGFICWPMLGFGSDIYRGPAALET